MNILYQDEQFVAVNKPAGLLVHRSLLDRHETDFAVQTLRDTVGQYVYPAHRLDRPTSGVLLFALSSEAASALGEMFRGDGMNKTYIAAVRGYTEESGEIDKPLRRIIDKYGEPARKSDEEQEAVTHYRRLATLELPVKIDRYPSSRYSLVELSPKTGRRHQLRRHMKHISHPIIGDPKYGKSRHNNYFKETYDASRLMLHAAALQFTHPFTGKEVKITAQPEDSFSSVISLFGFDLQNYLMQL